LVSEQDSYLKMSENKLQGLESLDGLFRSEVKPRQIQGGRRQTLLGSEEEKRFDVGWLILCPLVSWVVNLLVSSKQISKRMDRTGRSVVGG